MIPNFPSVFLPQLLYTSQELMAFGRCQNYLLLKYTIFLFPPPHCCLGVQTFPTVPLSLTIPKNFKADRLMETDWGEVINNTPALINSYCQNSHGKGLNKTFKVGVPSGSQPSAVTVCRSSLRDMNAWEMGCCRTATQTTTSSCLHSEKPMISDY